MFVAHLEIGVPYKHLVMRVVLVLVGQSVAHLVVCWLCVTSNVRRRYDAKNCRVGASAVPVEDLAGWAVVQVFATA